jgi:hypothetical protein
MILTIVRIALLSALTFMVYLEAGLFTAIAIAWILIDSELKTAWLKIIAKRLNSE